MPLSEVGGVDSRVVGCGAQLDFLVLEKRASHPS